MFKHFIVLILCLPGTVLYAQNLTQTPYSRFGAGEQYFQGFAAQAGMGYLTQGQRDRHNFSIMNPASYSALDKTNFQFGALATVGRLSDSLNSQNISNASLAYIALAFQINKKKDWGLAMGLMPYSAVGYNIVNRVDSSFSSFDQKYEGRGGINRVFIGTGSHLAKIGFCNARDSASDSCIRRTYIHFAGGANFSYLFGQTEMSEVIEFDDIYSPYQSYRETESNHMNGFNVELGTQVYFQQMLTRGSDTSYLRHSFGATYTLPTNLNATREYYARTYWPGFMPETVKDTIAYQSGVKGTVTLPPTLAFGYFVQNVTGRWKAGIEFKTTNWTRFSSSFKSEKLVNDYQLAIGGAFIPVKNLNDKKSFLMKTEYRLGVRYGRSNLNISGNDVNQLGINVGFGLPLLMSTWNEAGLKENVYSRLNLAVEYFVRGTTENNLIREEQLRFTLGVSLNDKWFNKRKID